MAAIATQHREQTQQTRAQRLQQSQEGDPVAATQHREQTRHTRQSHSCTHGAGYSSAPMPVCHVLGPCTFECQGCSALHFQEETSERGFFSSCCAKGKVSLPPLDPTPNVLIVELFQEPETFMPFIRAYNSALSFASIGANVDDGLIDCTHGIYTFRIHGSMYHRLGSLLPAPGQHPAFAQLYFYDSEHDADNRLHHMNNLDKNTIESLQQMIQNENRLYGFFKQALDEQTLVNSSDRNDVQLPGHNLTMHILDQPELDHRRYNRPSSSEVAVILPDQGSGNCDIRVLHHGGVIQSISELHPDYSPLAYVLLFPTGNPQGWHPNMMQTGPNAMTPPSTKLTCLMHAAFRLFVRPAPMFFNHHHLAGKLFHQYIVDCYAQVEQGHLNFIRHNQPKLRAELYQGIAEAVAGEDVTNT